MSGHPGNRASPVGWHLEEIAMDGKERWMRKGTKVYFPDGGVDFRNAPQAEERAALAAAAPALLASLKQALRYIEVKTVYQGGMTVAQVEAAIKSETFPSSIEIWANIVSTLARFDFEQARAAIKAAAHTAKALFDPENKMHRRIALNAMRTADQFGTGRMTAIREQFELNDIEATPEWITWIALHWGRCV